MMPANRRPLDQLLQPGKGVHKIDSHPNSQYREPHRDVNEFQRTILSRSRGIDETRQHDVSQSPLQYLPLPIPLLVEVVLKGQSPWRTRLALSTRTQHVLRIWTSAMQ